MGAANSEKSRGRQHRHSMTYELSLLSLLSLLYVLFSQHQNAPTHEMTLDTKHDELAGCVECTQCELGPACSTSNPSG
jgi:hypothetical protein